MAVPKHKTSKARRDTRSSHNFKANTNTTIECPQCHAPCKPHGICKECGYYKGTKRIETRKERKDKKSDSKTVQ